jgi:hypothetical protein
VRILPSKRKYGIGLGYLVPSYFRDPAPNPASIPGFTNPHMKFLLCRQTWGMWNRDGEGVNNITFLDNCFSTAEANGKGVALQIEPGINSPPWFFALPGADQETLVAGANLDNSTIPWGPLFQTKYQAAITQISNRYKGHSSLKFVKIQGPGIASESFLAKTPAEQAQCDTLAARFGYADKFAAWLSGVSFLIDMYASLWYPTPVQLVTGSPYGNLDGSIALLQEAYDYGDSHHYTQFAAVAHDLNSVNPKPGDIAQTEISALSPHSSGTGYQFGDEQNDLTKLTAALNKGVGYGAHEIEMFAGDADEPSFASLIDSINTQMLQV